MESFKFYLWSLFLFFAELILPQKCIICNTHGTLFCSMCISGLQLVGRETDIDIIALFDYRDNAIKKAIWHLKYYRSKNIGVLFGKILYEHTLEDISSLRSLTRGLPLIVIPVPLTRAKIKIRGYNQAETIARSFCECNPEVLQLYTHVIIKKHNTLPQARLHNRSARLKNIKGTFEIHEPNILKGRTVILIDDVTTTGGTFNEIMKLCKKAKVKKVIGLALAH